MMQRDGLDDERLVLIDDLGLLRVIRLEGYLHREIGTEVVEEGLEDAFCVLLGMDDDFAGTLPQAQGRDESHESQAMVSMQMAQQDVSHLAHGHMITSEADLHTLAAIHQEEIASEIDNLGRRRMAKRWLRTTAAQNS